jgi:hypothetical protein
MTDTTPTIIQAVADLAKGLAWPLVALFVSVFYRIEIRDLVRRIRKGGGAEFDPPPQTAASLSGVDGALPAASVATASLPATPTVVALEQLIRELPAVKTAPGPAEREAVLLRLVARAALVARFEQIDGAIWKSQLDLLSYLNSKREGESLSQLKQLFYDKAAAQHSEVFANYPFERYLGFLRGHGLIEIPGDTARITQDAIEYLAWRLEQGRPPKVTG